MNDFQHLPFFYRETDGIRITVRPRYLENKSHPVLSRFVFAYHVRIENVSAQPAQLLTRYWLIRDSIGEDTEVTGEGVVGQQPLLGRGEIHEYESFCVLKSSSGTMEGSYHFVRQDGTRFDAAIPRFYLEADEVV